MAVPPPPRLVPNGRGAIPPVGGTRSPPPARGRPRPAAWTRGSSRQGRSRCPGMNQGGRRRRGRARGRGWRCLSRLAVTKQSSAVEPLPTAGGRREAAPLPIEPHRLPSPSPGPAEREGRLRLPTMVKTGGSCTNRLRVLASLPSYARHVV